VSRRRDTKPAKPHSKKKAAARVLSPNEEWAAKWETKILDACHPDQRDAVEDPHDLIAYLVGRGGGKTTAARARAVIKMMKMRKARIVYIALTRPSAEELNWLPLKDMIDRLGLTEEFTFNESKMRCTCKRTGSTYRMVGADKKHEIDKLRGQSFDEVQIDECGAMNPELLEMLIDRVVGPRMRGPILLLGTPGHLLRGPFYAATRRGSADHRPYKDRNKAQYADWINWSSHTWSLAEVVRLPEARTKYPELIKLWQNALKKKLQKRWSDENPIWRREYLGEWAADDTTMVFRYRPHLTGEDAAKRGVPDGTAWNQWDPFGTQKVEGLEALKIAIAALPKNEKNQVCDWHYVLTEDMGSRDPFAATVLAFDPADEDKSIWHVYTFEQRGMYAKRIAELELGPDPERAHEKPQGLMGVIGWPDGSIIDSDQALIDELARVYGLQKKKASRQPDQKYGSIELVNGDLVDGRIKVIKGSILEQQLQELQWKQDEYGFLREDKAQANHSTDTLVYGRRLLAEMFESGVVDSTADRNTQVQYEDPMGLGEESDPAVQEDDRYLADPEYTEDAWGNE
jgi:hypothetical protein